MTHGGGKGAGGGARDGGVKFRDFEEKAGSDNCFRGVIIALSLWATS